MTLVHKTLELYLISGFLGSGKTTLLLYLMNLFKGKKIGIIQNEYGTVSIDGIILRNENQIDLIEINDGSIFCVCKNAELIEALIKMASLHLDTIFIEASGISDPSNFLRDLNVVNSNTRNIYTYRGNICLIDAENVLDLVESLAVIEKQIKYADWIILNKIDLVTKKQIHKISEKIRSINLRADIIETEFCKLPKNIFNMNTITAKRPEPESSQNTLENRLLKTTLIQRTSLEVENVKEFLNNIVPETIRIKGFFYDSNKIPYFISGVNGSFKILETRIKNIEYKFTIIFRKEVVDLKILELIEKNWQGLASNE